MFPATNVFNGLSDDDPIQQTEAAIVIAPTPKYALQMTDVLVANDDSNSAALPPPPPQLADMLLIEQNPQRATETENFFLPDLQHTVY